MWFMRTTSAAGTLDVDGDVLDAVADAAVVVVVVDVVSGDVLGAAATEETGAESAFSSAPQEASSSIAAKTATRRIFVLTSGARPSRCPINPPAPVHRRGSIMMSCPERARWPENAQCRRPLQVGGIA
jgi:hypothetical protein